MGKKKNKKFGTNRINPTGLSAVGNEGETEGDDSRSAAVITGILEQLQSVEEETRECGCSTLAALAPQPGALPMLLKTDVLRILAPLILDPSPGVRHRALGALRNITVDGGSAVCQEMVQKDVITPLAALFRQYQVNWQPDKDTKHTDTKCGIFSEAVHVLWNLCENSEAAVLAFNREGLLSLLLPCLQHGVYGYPLAITVAQCLHTVTENNQDANAYCCRPEILSDLHTLLQNSDDSSCAVYFQTLLHGILINVMGEEFLHGTSLDTAVCKLAIILDLNLSPYIAALREHKLQQNGLPECSGDKVIEKEVFSSDPVQSECEMQLFYLIDAQRLALELLANMCCTGDEEWEDIESTASGSSDEFVNDVDMAQEDACVENSNNPLTASSEIHAMFVKYGIVQKAIKLACAPYDELFDMVRSSLDKKLCKRLMRLRMHALLCVNNLVDSMTIEALGGMEVLHKIWDTFAQQIFSTGIASKSEPSATPKPAPDILEALTSVLHAIVQKLAQIHSHKFLQVSSQDLQILVGLTKGASCGVQIHLMHIVAAIASFLAKADPQHTILQEMGSFLLSVASENTDVVVVAEALDALFDVFADDSTDPLARQLGLTEHLRLLLPNLKSKLHSHRKQLGENYVTVSTAKTNLIRFLKYKASMTNS